MTTLTALFTWALAHQALLLGIVATVLWLIANVAPRPHPETCTGWKKALWGVIDRLCLLTAEKFPGVFKWILTASPSKGKKPQKAAGVLLVLLCLAAPVGCAAFFPIVAAVIAAVVDAIPIIDSIADFVDEHFSKHNDAIHEAQARSAIARTREALVRSERNARLCEDDPCVEAAFEPFRAEYRKLVGTLEAAPGVKVVKATASPDGAPGYKLLMSDGSSTLVLREPLVMESASW
jgi:hypothetical protein